MQGDQVIADRHPLEIAHTSRIPQMNWPFEGLKP
jgi:hypothetical protein